MPKPALLDSGSVSFGKYNYYHQSPRSKSMECTITLNIY